MNVSQHSHDMFRPVLEETLRFRAALPSLMKSYAGKWVVFSDGAVSSVHGTEDDAYYAGMTMFGRHGCYVVDRVERKHAVPLTAAVVYG
ncbi:MAG: hypothetical protein ACI9WU_004255 [Myxococcota bacterium]